MSAVIRDGLGDLYEIEFLEVFSEGNQVLRFALVIELLLNRDSKFVQDFNKAMLATDFGVRIEKFGDLSEHFKIFGDLFSYVGPLDFDDDQSPIAEGGGMNLAKGRGSNGLRIELRKSLGDSNPQLGGYYLFHLLVRKGFDLILEPGQGFQVSSREEVGTPGEN